MKTLKALSALSLVAALIVASSPAEAMKWTRGDRSNIIDCRSGWYCSYKGWIDIGASWDHIWSGWFD